jgi:MFS family permease
LEPVNESMAGQGRSFALLIASLGVAQIISWGSLFYAIAVLGAAIRRDLGVSEVFLFGSFTAGLVVSGTISPLVGRLIDKHGGRFTLSIGSVIAAASMIVLAGSINSGMLLAGWLLAGAAMAFCLYDPAFATLSQHTGARYRQAVTALTLFGGFASTVFWLFSYTLMQAWGWRAALGVFAALHLMVCLPLHWWTIPRRMGTARHQTAPGSRPAASPGMGSARLGWLTASFALGTFVFSVVAVHIISLLTAAGLTLAQAVSISLLVGPMQVLGRIVELALGRRIRSVTVGLTAFGLMLVSLVALLKVQGPGAAPIIFVTAYGCGNGLLTIARGTVPGELFGLKGLGSVLGRISGASLYARSVAPASLPAMLAVGYSGHGSLMVLGVLALAGLGSYVLAARHGNGPRAAAR